LDYFIKSLEILIQDPDERDNFREFLLPHFQVIYMSALRLSGNEADAEDLVQETFYSGIKKFHQIKDREKTKYWLFSIMRNLFLKEVHKKKNRSEIQFDLVCGRLHDNKNLERDLLIDEVRGKIQEVLEALNERLKIPITLFYFEGKSYKEISETLNVPIGTVMSRIARAKVHLKRELTLSESFRSSFEQYFIEQD
jgi:RNA polymerase sigma-70 factor (ECF subfamily)